MSRVRGALVAAVVGSVLLGGCAAQPGTAAVIEGRTISQDELDRTVAEVGPLLSGADTRSVLVGLMVAPYFIDAAEENGVAVSTTEIRGMMDEAAEAQGATPADWSPASVDLVRFSFAASNLQALPEGPELLAAVEQDVFAADSEVNPRYGRLDQETGQIVPLELPWITAGTQPSSGDAGQVQDKPTQE